MGQSESIPDRRSKNDRQYFYFDGIDGGSNDDVLGQEQKNNHQPRPKTDLLELNDVELKMLLSIKKFGPIDPSEIRSVAQTIAEGNNEQINSNDDEGKKGNGTDNNQTTRKVDIGFYAQEADSPYTQLAVKVNGMSSALSNVRFQLVPSRVKEPIFWQATFQILTNRLRQVHENKNSPSYDTTSQEETKQPEQTTTSASVTASPSRRRKDQDVSTKQPPQAKNGQRSIVISPKNGNTKSLQTTNKKGNEKHTKHVTIITTTDDPPPGLSLEEQLAFRTTQVQELRQQLQQLQKLQEPSHSEHTGTWVMDKDSREFLEFPDELKENMRQEKQKRLNEVRAEMKFILDSDNIEDSTGQWSCCGAKEYKMECKSTTAKTRTNSSSTSWFG